MPVDHRRRFDQHHGVEDLRPDPVKPYPEQPVGGEEPRPAGVVPAQDDNLMSQGDEFEFQRNALRIRKESREPRADRSVSMPKTV